MNFLITGFEPFDGSPINPSERVAIKLMEETLPGVTIKSVILPVDGQRGPAALLSALQEHQPRAVICLGEASGNAQIGLERVAINLSDYRIPDNSGNICIDQPVIPAAPAAYFSTLPLRTILSELRAAGIPADLSLSAGTYLCNQVFYTLMHSINASSGSIPAGFIHLPSLPSQIVLRSRPGPSMSLETSLQAIRIAIRVVCAVIGS